MDMYVGKCSEQVTSLGCTSRIPHMKESPWGMVNCCIFKILPLDIFLKFKDYKLQGLVAAVFTPFAADGKLNLPVVDKYVDYLVENDVKNVFVAGTTGESLSMTVDERKALAEKWVKSGKGRLQNIVIHVGCDCLIDSKELAKHAQAIGADAISAMPPVFMKPSTVDALVSISKGVASAAPDLPFFYYHIPHLTGVNLDMEDYCQQASLCPDFPNFCGVKYSSPNMTTATQCMVKGHRVLWGCDDVFLGAYALGIKGAIGSTYNFMPQLYHKMLRCFDNGDLEGARREAYRSQVFVKEMYKYPGCSFFHPKFIMTNFGVDVGPCRQPLKTPSADEIGKYQQTLQEMGFFDWVKKSA